MLIEHTFVTTLDSGRTMATAAELLALGGFERAAGPAAFALDNPGWTSLEVRRGKKSAARARDATQCPQSVRLEWDRGRVNTAAAIDTTARHRSFLSSGVFDFVILETRRSSRRNEELSNLMVAICRALEMRLVYNAPLEQATADWFVQEEVIRKNSRQRRVRSWIVGGFALLVIIGASVLIGVAAANRPRYQNNPVQMRRVYHYAAPVYPKPMFPRPGMPVRPGRPYHF